jgi:hypothetical protein
MAHTDAHGHVAGHETRDVDLTGAYRFLIVMVVFLAIVFAGIWFTYVKWRSDAAASQTAASPVAARDGDRLPPLPRLQTTPYADLKTFRASEDEVLHGYAWVDRQQGIVRIPIERAIALIAERGLPAPPAAPAAADAANQPHAAGVQ